MLAIAEKPADSAIEEIVEPDALTLCWNQPSQPAQSFLIGYSLVVIFIIGSWELRHIGWIVRNQANVNWFWSILLVWVFVLHLVHLVRLFRPMVPESVTLGSDYLLHDTGRAFVFMHLQRVQLPNGKRIISGMTPRHICKIPLEDVRRLNFGRVAGRPAIQYNAGRLQLEIGQFLSVRDREWLSGVLRAWRTAALGGG